MSEMLSDRLRDEVERLKEELATTRMAFVNCCEEKHRMREAAKRVTTSYFTYRGKGVVPAPTAYSDLVASILELNAALAAREGA